MVVCVRNSIEVHFGAIIVGAFSVCRTGSCVVDRNGDGELLVNLIEDSGVIGIGRSGSNRFVPTGEREGRMVGLCLNRRFAGIYRCETFGHAQRLQFRAVLIEEADVIQVVGISNLDIVQLNLVIEFAYGNEEVIDFVCSEGFRLLELASKLNDLTVLHGEIEVSLTARNEYTFYSTFRYINELVDHVGSRHIVHGYKDWCFATTRGEYPFSLIIRLHFRQTTVVHHGAADIGNTYARFDIFICVGEINKGRTRLVLHVGIAVGNEDDVNGVKDNRLAGLLDVVNIFTFIYQLFNIGEVFPFCSVFVRIDRFRRHIERNSLGHTV